MKVVFVSNFLNHHQLPFCEEMIKRLGKENFKFIATEKIPDERIKLGYEDMNNIYPFVIRAYENQKEALDFSVFTVKNGSNVSDITSALKNAKKSDFSNISIVSVINFFFNMTF